MALKPIIRVVDAFCREFSYKHRLVIDGGERCGKCGLCRVLVNPLRRIDLWLRRFGYAMREHIRSVLSPENLALGLSAICYAFFYGILFTLPVYLMGCVLGGAVVFRYDDSWPAWWDLESAWALTTFCMLLLKEVSFTVCESDEELRGD